MFIGRNCMAVKEGRTELLSILEKGIELARKKGVLVRINRKWLGVTYGLQVSFWDRYGFILSMMVGSLALVLVIVWCWNIRLRKEVQRRTASLVHSERELRLANEEWERTFDAVPDLIAILDRDYRIQKMNRAMSNVFSLDKAPGKDMKCYEVFHGLSEPPSYCPHAVLLMDGREHAMEIYEKRFGANFLVSVSPLMDSAGQLTGSVHIARDITERKRREKKMECLSAMRENLLRATRFSEKMDIIKTSVNSLYGKAIFRIWMIDEESEGIDTSFADPKGTLKIRKTIATLPFTLVANSCDCLPAESSADWDSYESDCMEHLIIGNVFREVFDGHKKEGIPANHYFVGYPILSNAGSPIGVFLFLWKNSNSIINTNILESVVAATTHVFCAEKSSRNLRVSEKRYRELFESLMDVYFKTDTSGKIKMVSPSVKSMMGFLPEEILNTDAAGYWVNSIQMNQFTKEVQENDTLHNRDVLLKKKDGSSFWASCNAKQIKDTRGNFAGVEVILRNVTENKLAEELMRIQRDLSIALIHARDFNEALNICLDAALKIKEVNCGGIYLVDQDTGGLDLKVHREMPPDFVNAVFHLDCDSPQARMLSTGQSIFQPYEAMMDCFGYAPSDRKHLNSFGLRAVAVIPMSLDGEIIGCLNVASVTDDGFSEFSKSNLETIAGQMAAALVKIEVDQALRVNQRNLKTLFESLDDFLFILDDSGCIIKTNPAVESRLGYPVDELANMHVVQVHPPERQQEAAEIVQQMLAGQIEFCPIPLMARDGILIPVETKVTKGTWNDRPALFGISRDITSRLEAEEAKRTSEARLMAAIETIGEGFVIYDNEDRLVLCNNKYLEIYRDSADLIKPGARFEDIIRQGAYRGQYSDAKGDIENWIAKRLFQHQHCDLSLEQKLGDGRWLRIEERKMEDGSTVGFRVDITDIKRSEELLRRALKEKETLLREIHHRVKNNLAVISSMLNLQVKHNKNKVVRESLEESCSRVRSMALIHETLHQTNDLSVVQLKDYVRKLIRDLLSVYENFSDQFSIEYDIGDVDLDLNQAVYCGLIINELVTNSLKYAFVGKKKGTIHILARQIGDDGIQLSVKDDGIGLPPTVDWRNARTLGLRLIALMAEQLHGSLELNSQNGLETVIQWKSSLLKTTPRMAS